jgi:LacI family transcriptional regulator
MSVMMRPTLQDLAREAGGSSATVDRVLNNRQGVKPRTREIVLSTARRLGYLPGAEEPVAPPLRLVRLLFLLPSGTNAFIAALHRQIESQTGEREAVEASVKPSRASTPNASRAASTMWDPMWMA